MAKSPILTLLALFFGAVAFGFGVNAILKPASEIAMFELTSLAATADPVLIGKISQPPQGVFLVKCGGRKGGNERRREADRSPDALMTAFGAKLLGAAAAIFSTAYFGYVQS